MGAVKRCILVVDDHAAVRHALALVLAEEGIGDCWEAGERREALEIAGQQPPDLALVDLSLDGALDLIEELSGRKIPVLVCSMREEPECVRRAMARERGATSRNSRRRRNWRARYSICSRAGS